VVAATRGLDRGRVSAAAVDDAFAQDLSDFVRVQQDAQLDYFSDGLLRWQDVFRPLVEAAPALTAHTLVRWFDNNAFFRAPQPRGRLNPISGPDAIVPDPSVPRPRVATLPSPYLFSRAAVGVEDRNQFMLELAQSVLRPAVERLSTEGCELVQLQEPWLPYFGIADGDWAPLRESLAALRSAGAARIVLSLYFGDAGPHLKRLRSLPVDALGIDLVETDVAELGSGWEMGLVAGCLNGRSSLLESMDDTVDLIRHLAAAVRPSTLYISSNSDLELLPTAVAQRKVLLLGEVARRAKERVAA
jgi:5-methyltetrahydropteroyltriglutamate--homocysteine methyltransferase